MPSLGCRIDCGDVVKVVIPEHKPKSYSMSAARPGEFDITFKVYPGGRCSGYLDSVKVGQNVLAFAKGKKERNLGVGITHVGVVAFGVGITEGLPIAEAELLRGGAERVHLVWAARTHEDMFWHEQIDALLREHAKFAITRILSREDREGCLRGRVNTELFRELFHGWVPQTSRFLAVGTKQMMSQAYDMLEAAGFPFTQCALLTKPHKSG
ncbi:putative oxidoreductase [Chloropicon roscoffensis]|uniref:Oxidoreductase n=1 Tax=Chloropicon roscoffensis TaxID=1461544 RepID=A0AAX4PNJ0_9CHLO